MSDSDGHPSDAGCVRSPLRVALAGDDTPLVRTLQRRLRQLGHEPRRTPAAMEAVLALGPVDAVVLALDSLGRPELKTLAALAAKRGDTPLLVVGERPAARESRRGIADCGASFLAVGDLATHLEQALRMATSGYRLLPQEFRAAPRFPLTAREKQILGLVVMGLSNGEIASRLFVEETTVKTHLSSVFAKLGVSSRREAAALVLDPAMGLGPGILMLGGEEVDVVQLPQRLRERADAARLAS
jgi:DNA-binding NarL/FixJ family response regulator